MFENGFKKWFKNWKNNLELRIENALDQTDRPSWFSFEGFLFLVSIIYIQVIRLHLWMFEKKILTQKALPCFVISIGNITVGGTGKTPMTLYIAQTLVRMGKKPVVVSRGYKGQYQGQTLVVSDGNHVFADSKTAGDEPYMLAQKKICPVVVGKSRFKAGQIAIENFNPDVIILDDGFQHLGLKRDLDFVLFDDSNPLGNTRYLPSGRLREPVQTAAKRAHALVFTRCPLEILSLASSAEDAMPTPFAKNRLQSLMAHFNALPEFKTCHVPFVCEQILPDKPLPNPGIDMEYLKGKKALLFSGLAGNASFYETLDRYGAIIVDHLEFKDHYRYKRADFKKINTLARQKEADIILTTQKDRVKIPEDIKWETQLAVIGIQIQFQTPERFLSFLNQKINFNQKTGF
ncbi:MAG: tetraacyldisaccharide 4'-kinase [Proteobacteria bacterium]|nr:tetraacyldisaccharide 4'-kinase [Pseudomonadota bacterium]MBU1389660.1 tetraacyldisaccharide 4'-kinase [Pseudomonadota bacterium]MBU1542598.1 tetraacyldisaccharide 4'-kinase [Pseudomonadota bacterium]MBU2480263.1 tetraacyldisaccharide 4'-kinase [Pseudomonadota bacterium]